MTLPTILPSRATQGGGKDRTGPVYTLAWSIIAGSAAAAYDVLRDEGVFIGAPYVDHNGNQPDDYLACQALNHRELRAAPTGGTGLYEIEAVFTYTHFAPAPLWRTETALVSVECEFDYNGQPIVNAVGEPFVPLSQRLVPESVLVREWLQFFANREAAEAALMPFAGCVNIAPYRGKEAGCLLAEAPMIEEQWGYGTLLSMLFRCQMRFAYRPPVTVMGDTWPGWHEVRPHKGYSHIEDNKLVPNGGYPIDPDTGEKGAFQKFTQPQWLNFDGTLATGPVYKAFQKYPYADFNNIGG
jgi:hypothetical protein